MSAMRGRLIDGATVALLGWVLGGHLATADPKQNDFEPARTLDGHANLEGLWDSINLTPLERPAQFSSRAMSDDDARKAQERWIAMRNDVSVPGDPTDANNLIIETIRGERRSSVVIDPPDGRIPGNENYRRSVSKARVDVMKSFDHPEQRPLGERCIISAAGNAPFTTIPANNFHQIVQTPDAIALASESMHEARIVRMNAKHAPAGVAMWTGDSVGKWDGDTLVVETRNFRNGITIASQQSVFFLSETATVIERFTLVAPDILGYVFIVEDPTYYTRPWTGETIFRRSNERTFEYACHEGNYAIEFMLQGARENEARAEGRVESTRTEQR